MDIQELSKQINQKLIDNGFSGIIAMDTARRIRDKVLSECTEQKYKVTIELAPVHRVGKPMLCNCSKRIVKVVPKN